MTRSHHVALQMERLGSQRLGHPIFPLEHIAFEETPGTEQERRPEGGLASGDMPSPALRVLIRFFVFCSSSFPWVRRQPGGGGTTDWQNATESATGRS